MRFELTPKEVQKVNDWLASTVYPAIIEKQKESAELQKMHFARDAWEHGYPYEGAIGGGVTYEFTPTSIGVVMKVKYAEFELDLTDYATW